LSPPLFLVDALPAGESARLDGPEGRHAADVQRLRVGETLLLGDGRGTLATATVTAVARGALDVRLETRRSWPEPRPALTVVQAIAKGERGERAVQAMTEVGVDTIVPWAAARSIAKWRDDRPMERWRATAREAAKQARRPWLPAVTTAESTAAVARRLTSASFVLDEATQLRLSTVELPPADEIVLVVGPEGGIAPEELATFAAAGAVPVRLGDTVLRTSTAGVAALCLLSVRLGRW
jgi:16S rRNA (uracil1498-N3)-methyltransferase